jgi:ribonuclease E
VDVATFLLNEKRADIHRIESRFKVGVTLIPNPHMETPHYSVTRLRQDDITADHLQASYKLVEKPEETKSVASAAQEAKAQRPQAAVKGITPAQPAPKHEEKAEKKTSLIGSLIGWFKSLSAPSEPVKPATPAKGGRQQQRRERGERGERGDRGEGGKQQRRERGEGGKHQRREREEAQRPENKEQQESRGERQQRQPRPAPADKPALETQKPAVSGEQGEEASSSREGRKRGRRGGRRERERREQQTTAPSGETGAMQQGETRTQPPVAEVTATAPRAKPTEYVAYPESMKKIRPTEVVCYPTQAPRAAEAVAPAAAPLDLSSSGLTMIETDPSKAASISAPESREHAPRRRQRPREIYTIENSEPLQQVETRSPN